MLPVDWAERGQTDAAYLEKRQFINFLKNLHRWHVTCSCVQQQPANGGGAR
jgi:hypothetical protein